jgi:hypothetical protein
MRKFEAGCVGVPRGDGSFFSTLYDVEGHGIFTSCPPKAFPMLSRAVFNFTSREEAEAETPRIIEALNKLQL